MTLKKMRRYGEGETPQELIPVIGGLNKRKGNIHMIVREMNTIEEGDDQSEISNFDDDNNDSNDDDDNFDDNYNNDDDDDDNSDERIEERREPKQRKATSSKDKMDRIREEFSSSLFSIEEFEQIVISLGWKREKAVVLLKGLMDSGDVYCPRPGTFRFVV